MSPARFERLRSLRHVARLRHVSRRDWPAVFVTVATGLGVEIGLRTMKLPRLARLVGAPLADTDTDAGSGSGSESESEQLVLPPEAVRRLQICVRILRRWPFDEKCLRLSLVCGHRIRSLRPRLVVGVALVEDQVRAHAWLTVDGVSLDPSGAADFAVLQPVRP